MQPSQHQIPPPKDWQEFERRMRDLFEAEWQSRATMHGRTGQPQQGVDIYGQTATGFHGVQCKGHDDGILGTRVTEAELTAEIDKARKFDPPLTHFILATTAQRDMKIQAVVRRFNGHKRKPFTIDVLFWDDIVALYERHRTIFERHYRFGQLPHQLPSPPRDFTGRGDELRDLLAAVGGGAAITGKTVPVGAGGLMGMPGVGKTALALVVAHRLVDDYSDAQFFIDLRGASNQPLSPTEALRVMIQALDPMTILPDDPTELRKRYLSSLHGMRALILADDAADAAQVRPLLPPAGCLLLVTSRRFFAVEGLAPVRLDCLPENEAIELMHKICPRIGDYAAPISKACGRLPLALRAAASLLAVRTDIRPVDYVEELSDERQRLETIGQEGVEIGVEASLFLTYRQLENQAPDTAHTFRLLAIFPGSFDAGAEEAICQDDCHHHLSELLRYCLVQFDEPAQRYVLHDLVRLFATARLDDRHNKTRLPAERRYAQHYATILRSAWDLCVKGEDEFLEGLSLFDRERHNIETGQARAAKNAEADERSARHTSDYAHDASRFFELRMHPRQRIQWLESALTAARYLKDRRAEGAHLGNFGSVYLALSDFRKALEYFRMELAIGREISDLNGICAAKCNMSMAHLSLGDHREAVACLCEALAIARSLGDRHGEGNILGNLGNALASTTQRWKAINYYNQQLEIVREIGDRQGEAHCLGNLASVYATIGPFVGDLDMAIKFNELSLAIHREIGDLRGEAHCLGNLGSIYTDLRQSQKAIEFHKLAQRIHREIGDRRGDGADSFNIAISLMQLRERDQAIALAEEAVAVFRQIGDPHAAELERRLHEWRLGGGWLP